MLVSVVGNLPGLLLFAFIVSVIAAIGMRAWFVTADRRAVARAIRTVGHDALKHLSVPDGMDGFIHVDCLVLTANGLVILDVRDIEGVIFGGAMMQEWVAMNKSRRDSFRNPLETLHDRVAAVRMHAGPVPVRGFVVFTNRGRFEKGMPAETLMVNELVAELGKADANDYPQAFQPAWNKFKEFVEKR